MKVVVFVKATKSSEEGAPPSQELLEAMHAYNEELAKAGVMLAGEGLKPSSAGVRVQFSGAGRTVVDGPFTETKELVAGFWIWQVKSMEDAIAWVKRCPNPMPEDSEIEIRPLYTLEDFGDPEFHAKEEKLREEVEACAVQPSRFERLPETVVAGLNETYTFENRDRIPVQWERFGPNIGKVPGQIGPDAYGVSWNHKPAVGFDYLTGVEVEAGTTLPDGFTTVTLPALRYVVFEHTRHVSVIPDTIEAIWTKWLPNSGHEAAEAPCFERYTPAFDPAAGKGGTEIWIALKE